MISSNYLGALFGCKVQDLFNENMLMKHLLGFLTLYFFVNLVDTSGFSGKTPVQKLYVSFGIYLVFMMSTKLNLKMFYVFILSLMGIYVLYIIKDTSKDEDQKKMISNVQTLMSLVSAVALVVGFFYYMGQKKIEYGNKFSFTTFLLGNPSCRHANPKIKKSIKDVLSIALNKVRV
jgi:hypothetical protein